jgi:hypothetical protein
VQRPLAARFDGEVAGGAVADFFFVIFRFGATMELGRSGRSMMMMTSASASASGGDGGVAGSLSEVQRRTGSSTAIAKFRSTDMGLRRALSPTFPAGELAFFIPWRWWPRFRRGAVNNKGKQGDC